jgi:multidrug efflux system membrane fusion protein
VVVLVAAAIVGFAIHRKSQTAANAKPPAGGRGAAGNFPISVVVGTASKNDVPIYMDGLGTVQAFNTVTIRSRVDGELQKVAFTEGQDVKFGDLLAQIDPEPFKTQVAQAEARKATDEALLANARVDLSRQQTLLNEKIVAPDVYDTAKYLVAQLEATVKSDQAAIDNANVQLAYTKITAPIEGRTGIRQVDQGNIIHATDQNGIVVLTQLKPISVVFTLPEQALGEIQSGGNPTDMKVVAVDRDNHTVLGEGKLAVIDNQIDPSTGTIKLKATFPNLEQKLWPGQFVNARLLLKVRRDATTVPASVVQRGPDGAYAFVVKDDMSVEMRPIQVARIESDRALIDRGLDPGEKIVVDGQYKLQPGSKIKPVGPGGDNPASKWGAGATAGPPARGSSGPAESGGGGAGQGKRSDPHVEASK